MISILCVAARSNYFSIPDLDLWPEKRDAYLFTSSDKVIAHPPCAQWSRLRRFSKEDARSKELAVFCFDKVNSNGGVFEHPMGSSFCGKEHIEVINRRGW